MKCAREIVWSGLIASVAVSAFGAGMLQPGSTPAAKPTDSVIAPPSPRDARDLGIGRYVADDGSVLALVGAGIGAEESMIGLDSRDGSVRDTVPIVEAFPKGQLDTFAPISKNQQVLGDFCRRVLCDAQRGEARRSGHLLRRSALLGPSSGD